MRLTTARYYTPSGRSIQAKGIEPDIEVKPAKVEELESYALNISEAELNNALKNDNEADSSSTKKNGKSKEDLEDYQLVRALDLVKALALYSNTDNR
jgi:carboxyl-terminal processing protease